MLFPFHNGGNWLEGQTNKLAEIKQPVSGGVETGVWLIAKPTALTPALEGLGASGRLERERLSLAGRQVGEVEERWVRLPGGIREGVRGGGDRLVWKLSSKGRRLSSLLWCRRALSQLSPPLECWSALQPVGRVLLHSETSVLLLSNFRIDFWN